MPEASNPYAAPPPQTSDRGVDMPLPHEFRMVNQVTAVGVMQIVLGALELLIATLILGGATIFSLAAIAEDDFANDDEAIVVQIVYFALGTGFLASSAMRIGTGICCFRFRARGLAILSLTLGMATSLFCYCAPFALGVGIYGLIVMFNPAVAKAYQMRALGIAPKEVKAHFAAAAFGQAHSRPAMPATPQQNAP